MDFQNPELLEKFEQIFMPFIFKARNKLSENNTNFVHYTSAENALKIIDSKAFWLRSPKCMNDYMEIYHGHKQLEMFFSNEHNRSKFDNALDAFGEALSSDILVNFDNWWKKIENDTFIASISEHHPSENDNGRLSMWRAYGGTAAKTAMILNRPPQTNIKLGIILSPALYFSYQELEATLTSIIDEIEAQTEFLKSLPRDVIVGILTVTFIILAITLKHPGFQEEKEWRMVYLPTMMQENDWVKRSVEVIAGVPQLVYKLPLKNNKELGVTGLDLGELLEGIIIGPSEYPLTINDAFRAILGDTNLQELKKKVVNSNIPLRT